MILSFAQRSMLACPAQVLDTDPGLVDQAKAILRAVTLAAIWTIMPLGMAKMAIPRRPMAWARLSLEACCPLRPPAVLAVMVILAAQADRVMVDLDLEVQKAPEALAMADLVTAAVNLEVLEEQEELAQQEAPTAAVQLLEQAQAAGASSCQSAPSLLVPSTPTPSVYPTPSSATRSSRIPTLAARMAHPLLTARASATHTMSWMSLARISAKECHSRRVFVN